MAAKRQARPRCGAAAMLSKGRILRLAMLGILLSVFQVGIAQAGSHDSGSGSSYSSGDSYSSGSSGSGGDAYSGGSGSGGGDAYSGGSSGGAYSGGSAGGDQYGGGSGGGDVYSPGSGSGAGSHGGGSCDHGANPIEKAEHLKHCALHCGLGVVPAMPGKDCMHKGIMCVTHCALGDIKLNNMLNLGNLGGLGLNINLGHSWDIGVNVNTAAGAQYGSGPKSLGLNLSLKADKPLVGQQIIGGH